MFETLLALVALRKLACMCLHVFVILELMLTNEYLATRKQQYITGCPLAMDKYALYNINSLSCFLICALQPCGHLLGKGLPLGSLVCAGVFLCVTFPCGGLGQVWYLIVSILYLWLLNYIK